MQNKPLTGMLLAALICLCIPGPGSNAVESRPDGLTANELAEALSVRWWYVQLPGKLNPGDSVGTQLINSEGRVVESEGGGAVGISKPGERIKIFCWEDKAQDRAVVKIHTKQVTGGFTMANQFKGANIAGPSNGTVLKEGDILIKFEKSKDTTFSGGNDLSKGQLGLRVIIRRGK